MVFQYENNFLSYFTWYYVTYRLWPWCHTVTLYDLENMFFLKSLGIHFYQLVIHLYCLKCFLKQRFGLQYWWQSSWTPSWIIQIPQGCQSGTRWIFKVDHSEIQNTFRTTMHHVLHTSAKNQLLAPGLIKPVFAMVTPPGERQWNEVQMSCFALLVHLFSLTFYFSASLW